MKRAFSRDLARDPRFIPGVYNYCDRWCERCPLSHRCLNYAMEKADEATASAPRDLANEHFWKKLHETFRETSEMIRDEARERGIDLDDPKLRAEVVAQERAERRRAAQNRPLARAARAYSKAVKGWMNGAKPLLAAKGDELKTQARLEIGHPKAEADRLWDFVDVIRWYQDFICVKLCRAIGSRASEEREMDAEVKRFPKDSDGTAKVALIAMDRSISAWAGLRAALGDDADNILDLLAQLAALRRETEQVFPEARAFVRPGFDPPGQEGPSSGPSEAARKTPRA